MVDEGKKKTKKICDVAGHWPFIILQVLFRSLTIDHLPLTISFKVFT